MLHLAPLVASLTPLLFVNLLPPPEKEPQGRRDIRGAVVEVHAANAEQKKAGLLGTLRIEGMQDRDTAYDRAIVKITTKTKIEKLVGDKTMPATFDDLKKGSKVEAWFDGPVAESEPVQASAGRVLVVEPAK